MSREEIEDRREHAVTVSRSIGRSQGHGAGTLGAVLRPLAPIAATAAVLLALAATASALPGDPPSEPLEPADGATVGEETVTGPALALTVKAARRWSTGARDDGAYRGRTRSRSVRLKVARRGRELRDFKAFVAMTCPGVQPGQFTTQIGTAAISRAKVAPDGRFVAARSTGGSTMRIRGRLVHGRIAEGRAELSVGSCAGNSAYAARRAG